MDHMAVLLTAIYIISISCAGEDNRLSEASASRVLLVFRNAARGIEEKPTGYAAECKINRECRYEITGSIP